MTEGRGRRAEDGGQRTEDGGLKCGMALSALDASLREKKVCVFLWLGINYEYHTLGW